MKDDQNGGNRDKGGNDEEINRRMVEFDKKLIDMEIERKGKMKDTFVDKLLQGTDSPFSQWVEAYQFA